MLAASLARAQPSAKLRSVGALYPNPSSGNAQGKPWRTADRFAEWLNELGWRVGTNVRIEDASAEGDNSRLPALARSLVDRKVDVIWAAGSEATIAAARTSTSTPIAFYGVGYPVEQGLVNSLARPGRNITGLASIAGDEPGKQLELLRETLPTAKRLAYLRTDTAIATLSGEKFLLRGETIMSGAEKLKFELRMYTVARPEDFEAAFAAIVADRSEVLAVQFTGIMYRERKRIADFALQYGLPSVHGAAQMVEAGGLFHYAANRDWMTKHSWTYVDRVLRGARPAELPVELPSKFEMFVNTKTAKSLGLTVPRSILLRADRLIE